MMTTLLAVYGSEGLIGRCDAKCYEATHPDCVCICGGRNHGVGRSRAIAQTREQALAWVSTFSQAHGLTPAHTELAPICQHTSLWEALDVPITRDTPTTPTKGGPR
jgi:hypothetical protein